MFSLQERSHIAKTVGFGKRERGMLSNERLLRTSGWR
jgi:hypothetical protein